ncbi:interleukin-15 [Latimeria chalumnae]|uniref:interleukin-15 n=1 Tax=Latimeria chalumnae TaxID=7897 RepID=UPI0003C13E83|nr:PREDICTED: interleukin-15 [Latimeria chalumnae]|eukprot:XP_006008993.1 PREDICTED: interleukin-15 [Latimeria chalumnae]
MSALLTLATLVFTKLPFLHRTSLAKKRKVRCICFHCYLSLYSIVFNFLNTRTGITLFVFCCVSVNIPRTEGNAHVSCGLMVHDLKELRSRVAHTSVQDPIDAMLYTPPSAEKPCTIEALKCFLAELEVIDFEYNDDDDKTGEVKVLIETLKKLGKSITEEGSKANTNCKQCEEFEVKTVDVFLAQFTETIQFLNKNHNCSS